MRILILLICLTGVVLTNAEAQGLSMSPTRLFFSGQPGETVTQTIRMGNISDRDQRLSISYKDWIRDESGNKIYFEAGSLEHSNATWLTTDQNTVLVPAGGDVEVQVTMHIPQAVATNTVTNSMLFLTQLPQAPNPITQAETGIGIVTLFEFGLHIYYTPPSNTISSLDITNIVEEPADEQGPSVAVYIHNDGNTIVDANVEFELTNTETGEDQKLKPIYISMFPDARQVVHFNLPPDIEGDYLGVAIIKIAGTNDIRVGEKYFNF